VSVSLQTKYNKAVIDGRLCPQSHILMKLTKCCSRLTSNWCCHLANFF